MTEETPMREIDKAFAAANEDLNNFANSLAGLQVEHDPTLRACEVRVRVGSQLWERIIATMPPRRPVVMAPAPDLDPEITG